MTEIRNVDPGKTVTIAEGPAKGRRVKVTVKGSGRVGATVGIVGADDGQSSAVRGSLQVTE